MRAAQPLSSDRTAAVLDFVREKTGLVFSENRRSAAETAIRNAMARAKLGQPDRYLAALTADSATLDDLIADLTVGETYFFRDPKQLAVVRDRILPALAAGRPPDHPLRIWSAGCATGEEAYTLAMLVRERLPTRTHRIIATDLSRTALDGARRAVYREWSFRGARDLLEGGYFERVGDRFELAPPIRNSVELRYQNLAEDAYPSLSTGIWGMDLILCRNVLIYFDAATVQRVARRLIASLSEDGWLVLGAADPVITHLVACDVVVTDSGLAYRRARKAGGRIEVQSPPEEGLRLEAGGDSRLEAGENRQVAGAGASEPGDVQLAEKLGPLDSSEPPTVRPTEMDDAADSIMLVRALANDGDFERAGQACTAALDRHPMCAELIYLYAVLLLESGHAAQAVEVARRALYLEPELVVAHLLVGGTLANLGELDRARRSLRNAERILVTMEPTATVTASDAEPAGRLLEMTRVQLRLLAEVA